ncbi:MAG: acetyl-CoA carboxylase carboxyltransferase subunit beta [Desulfomonilia bacterium]|nr:acetyl-CoA carboxylase carboxyl transferase subunit beta [Deltaproteobacteria bacterium]MDX9761562.1 acetyl-CoA carboxylase carboxyltransferase subunit beta [Desulfomonilia bacterium]
MSEVLDVAKKDGRWVECPSCAEIIITRKLQENLWVCHHCNHHFRLGARDRIGLICDEGSFEELALADHAGDENPEDAIRAGKASVKGMPCLLGVMDFSHKGGSMGVAMGRKIVQLMDAAQETGLPLVFFTASGGVRIHEGIWGLFQMLRTVHARDRITRSPVITVFTDPTTGGVTASFAALADVLLAEPGARIGFAGPRVIQTVLRSELPEDFQNAETLLANGLIDRIVPRRDLRDTLFFFLRWF